MFLQRRKQNNEDPAQPSSDEDVDSVQAPSASKDIALDLHVSKASSDQAQASSTARDSVPSTPERPSTVHAIDSLQPALDQVRVGFDSSDIQAEEDTDVDSPKESSPLLINKVNN